MKTTNRKISLLLLSVMLLAVFTGCGSKNDGLFKGIEWGSEKYEVQTKLLVDNADNVTDSADGTGLVETQENYLGVEGVNARIEYAFTDYKLHEIFVYLEFDENAFTNEEILERYAEILKEEYGKCKVDGKEMKTWITKKSEIQMANFSYGVIVLDYKEK